MREVINRIIEMIKRTAHQIADEHLASLWATLRDDPRAKGENCRRLIDEWLDFRLAHTSRELPALPLPK